MKDLWRNLGLALALIVVAWMADSVIDMVFFHEGTFLDLLFRGLPPVELYMRVAAAVTLLVFAVIVTFFQRWVQEGREALEASEARYRAYVEHAPDAVFVANEKGQFIDANEGAVRLLGYSKRELLDLSIPDIPAPESLEENLRGFASLQEAGQLSIEFTALRKDGSRVPISLDAVALPGDRFMAFCADITQRQRMETTLREDEKRFRDLVQSTSDWIWEVDERGRYTYCSHHVTGVLGYEPEEILGKSPFDLMPEEEAVRVGEIFQRIMAERLPIVDMENWNLSKDGLEVCLLTNGVPMFDEKGELLGYRGADKDITQRIRAEERLKASETRYGTVFDEASDIIFLLEPIPDGPPIIRDANPSALRSLGYEREELVGKPTSLVDAANSPEDLIPERRRIAREGGGKFEVLHRRKDGSTFIAEAAVREATIGGKVLVVAIERDVTERRRLELELLDSRDRLRKLTAHLAKVREEERRLLARELHDEVGMGLTAMRMDLRMVKGGSEEGQEVFAERFYTMIELVDDAIDRVNRLSHELRSPVLEMLGLREAVLAHAEEVAERKGVEMKLDLRVGDLEKFPERDTAVLRILQEALSNVVRHAQASRVEVALFLTDGNLVLEVRDDGIGITEEQLGHPDAFGLMGMRERAVLVGGTVEIAAAAQGGTLLRAMVPLESA